MGLPKSWADVTIEQYQKLLSVQSLFKDDIVDYELNMLSVFMDRKKVYAMRIGEVTTLVKQLSFISELPPEKLALEFKIKGKWYKPALITKYMTAGQFMDFSNIAKGCTNDEMPYHMHELIASMCIKRKAFNFRFLAYDWDYDGYDKYANDFLQLPMTVAYPYYVFFCKVLTNLQKPMLDYSRKEVKKNLKKAKKLLQSV